LLPVSFVAACNKQRSGVCEKTALSTSCSHSDSKSMFLAAADYANKISIGWPSWLPALLLSTSRKQGWLCLSVESRLRRNGAQAAKKAVAVSDCNRLGCLEVASVKLRCQNGCNELVALAGACEQRTVGVQTKGPLALKPRWTRTRAN